MGTVEPTWAVPSRREITDLPWLAYRARRDHTRPRHSGVTAALAWARGGRTAPVTGRDDGPTARRRPPPSCGPRTPPPPRASRRHPWPASPHGSASPTATRQPVDPDLTDGVWRTLRWLLGEHDQAAPMPLPVRHTDGSTPTAAQL